MEIRLSASNPLMALWRSRLSWRIGCWLFLSISLVGSALLVPTVENRQRELIQQLKDGSDGKVSWIIETYPQATGQELLQQVRQLYDSSMLEAAIGGAVYAPNGSVIGTFGQSPELTAAELSRTGRLQGSQVNVAWSVDLPDGEHSILISHDAQAIQADLRAYTIHLAALTLIISASVTLVMMVVLWPSLIRPILMLRQDLVKAGESVCVDDFEAEFASSRIRRRDELGEVIQTFQTMYGQICQAVSARKRIEAELREHNEQMRQYLSQVNRVTQAAADLERGDFAAEDLDELAVRQDELGRLARMFQHLAQEMQQREALYQQRVSSLQIEINQSKLRQEVNRITEAEYFQDFQAEMAALDLDQFWGES